MTPNSIARWPSAGRDLACGHVFGVVRNRHGSGEFIELLNEIDAYYPKTVEHAPDSEQPFLSSLQADTSLVGQISQLLCVGIGHPFQQNDTLVPVRSAGRFQTRTALAYSSMDW